MYCFFSLVRSLIFYHCRCCAICNILFQCTVYPKKYAHDFVVLCFVVVMQSFIMNSHEVYIHVHHGCFAGTGAIVRLPQCQWSKPDGYGKINQCITTTKHSKAKTVCIFLGIYCTYPWWPSMCFQLTSPELLLLLTDPIGPCYNKTCLHNGNLIWRGILEEIATDHDNSSSTLEKLMLATGFHLLLGNNLHTKALSPSRYDLSVQCL